MGSIKNQTTDKRDQAEAAWSLKAEYEELRCSLCGEQIIYVDREIFFKTGRCGTDASYVQRDD